MKLIHRLHFPNQSAWANWARQHTNIVSMEGGRDGNHWEGLKAILPAYRSITSVQIGDGKSTSFWWDSWNQGQCLATKFPCLLSHCRDSSPSVSEVARLGISSFLVTRLSPQAMAELNQVQQIILTLKLTQQQDVRVSRFISGLGKLSTSSVYSASITLAAKSSALSGKVEPLTVSASSDGCCFMTASKVGQTCSTRTYSTTTDVSFVTKLLRFQIISSSNALLRDSSGIRLACISCNPHRSNNCGICPGGQASSCPAQTLQHIPPPLLLEHLEPLTRRRLPATSALPSPPPPRLQAGSKTMVLLPKTPG